MKKLTAFIFLFMLYVSAWSQQQAVLSQQQARWEVSASAQAAKLSNIDKEFSSLPFSALLPGGGISIKYLGEHFTHGLQASYIGGSVQTSSHPAYRQDQRYLNIDYTGLYFLGTPDAAWRGGAGLTLQTLYDERTYPELINHNNTYDFAASLGLAGSITHSFNNIWSLSDQLRLPFVAWLAEPDDGRHVGSFSSFTRIKNALSINWNVSMHNKLSLTYDWDYYRIAGQRDVRQACHRMELAYHLIF